MRLNRTRFIEQPSVRFPRVAVHGKRADADESAQRSVSQRRVEQIARRDDGVHERIGKRLLAPARGQMKDDRHIPGRREAIGAGQQVARDDFDARVATGARVESGEIAGWPRKAAHIEKPNRSSRRLNDNAPSPRNAGTLIAPALPPQSSAIWLTDF